MSSQGTHDWFYQLFGIQEDPCRIREQLHCWKTGDIFHLGTRNDVESSSCARYQVGDFSTPTLRWLREQVHEIGSTRSRSGRPKLTLKFGDVSHYQADPKNHGATFQVASQFNCLEFLGPQVVPERGVTGYALDHTQGPASSISCGPACVYRNYFAEWRDEDGILRFGQTASHMINNLAALEHSIGNQDHQFFQVQGGYTLSDSQKLNSFNEYLERLTSEERDDLASCIRVGLHRDVQVTSSNWGRTAVPPSQIITQVFASACSVSYNRDTCFEDWGPFSKLVLKAAYEATFFASVLNPHSSKCFLTLLGGGAFGNRLSWISEAIDYACERAKEFDLSVSILLYSRDVPEEIQSLLAKWS